MKILQVFEIVGEKPDLKRFTPTTFIICESAVFCENTEIGFFKHPKNKAVLKDHFYKLILEGFTIRNISDPETIKQYEKAIKRESKGVNV